MSLSKNIQWICAQNFTSYCVAMVAAISCEVVNFNQMMSKAVNIAKTTNPSVCDFRPIFQLFPLSKVLENRF